MARPNSRTCRGFTIATQKTDVLNAAATTCSSPPVASITTRAPRMALQPLPQLRDPRIVVTRGELLLHRAYGDIQLVLRNVYTNERRDRFAHTLSSHRPVLEVAASQPCDSGSLPRNCSGSWRNDGRAPHALPRSSGPQGISGCRPFRQAVTIKIQGKGEGWLGRAERHLLNRDARGSEGAGGSFGRVVACTPSG